jgi:hypothetical protein
MATHKPPVVPEIAKAYENDPRTLLAQAAMKQGQSTAPVALGGYGYADGIARVLQGLAGSYANSKQEDKYTHGDFKGNLDSLPVGSPEWVAAQNQRGQDGVLALRQQRGVDGMTGLPGQAPPGAQGSVTEQIAQTLQGIPSAPQAAPPTAPVAPPAPPVAAPVQGGGPMGRGPFASGVRSPVPNPTPPSAPVLEAVPNAPPPVPEAVAPAPVGPTRSRMLDAAYRIMSDANPYESAQGQDMYTSGLSDQTKLDESAAERRQRLADMGYQSALSRADSGAAQDRGAAISERAAAQNRNFTSQERVGAQEFTSNESRLTRDNALEVARIHARAELQAAKIRSSGGGLELTPEESAALTRAAMTKRLDIAKLTRFQAKNTAIALLEADRSGTPLSAIDLHAYANLSANPTAQTRAMMLKVAPDVVRQMSEAGQKLNFSDLAFAGKAQAWAKGELNDPDFADFRSKQADVVQTLATVMRNTGATDKAVALEKDAAPTSMAPRAFRAWASAQFDQLMPRAAAALKSNLIKQDDYDAIKQAADEARRSTAVDRPSAKPSVAVNPYSDPGKEARYQAWLKSHGN